MAFVVLLLLFVFLLEENDCSFGDEGFSLNRFEQTVVLTYCHIYKVLFAKLFVRAYALVCTFSKRVMLTIHRLKLFANILLYSR